MSGIPASVAMAPGLRSKQAFFTHMAARPVLALSAW